MRKVFFPFFFSFFGGGGGEGLEWAVILVQATVTCAICILFHLLQLQSLKSIVV